MAQERNRNLTENYPKFNSYNYIAYKSKIFKPNTFNTRTHKYIIFLAIVVINPTKNKLGVCLLLLQYAIPGQFSQSSISPHSTLKKNQLLFCLTHCNYFIQRNLIKSAIISNTFDQIININYEMYNLDPFIILKIISICAAK